MSEKHRIGIIGAGKVASSCHIPTLVARTDVEIATIMTAHPEHAKTAAARFGAKGTATSIEELVATGIDSAFVLSPKEYHAEQCCELMERGVDVFCEKPMAMNLTDSERMAETAARTGRKLMMGFNRRFAPGYRDAMDTFAGKAPDVIIVQKSKPGLAYRATLENAIHMVDLLRHFCGEAVDVQALASYDDPDYERLCTAQMRFENGTVGILVANRCPGTWLETLQAHGCGKSIFVNYPDEYSASENFGTRTSNYSAMKGGMSHMADTTGFRGEMDHFFECLDADKQPLTNGEDALKTQLLIHRILISAGLAGLD